MVLPRFITLILPFAVVWSYSVYKWMTQNACYVSGIKTDVDSVKISLSARIHKIFVLAECPQLAMLTQKNKQNTTRRKKNRNNKCLWFPRWLDSGTWLISDCDRFNDWILSALNECIDSPLSNLFVAFSWINAYSKPPLDQILGATIGIDYIIILSWQETYHLAKPIHDSAH